MKGGDTLVHETTYEEEKGRTIPTARQLGIVMPNPSIWPLLCAAGIICMFSGLLFIESSTPVGVAIMLTGSMWWIGSLYKWLMTPLEDHH